MALVANVLHDENSPVIASPSATMVSEALLSADSVLNSGPGSLAPDGHSEEAFLAGIAETAQVLGRTEAVLSPRSSSVGFGLDKQSPSDLALNGVPNALMGSAIS